MSFTYRLDNPSMRLVLLKIAFIIFNHELSIVASAVKTIREKLNLSIDINCRTPESFADTSQLNEFFQSVQDTNVVIMHLMGGRGCLPNYDKIMAFLHEKKIPALVLSAPFDAEYKEASTVDKNDYETVLQYFKGSEADNFENMLLFLTNRFTGSNFKTEPPKKYPLEGIYHPQIGYIPTLAEYLEKVYSPEKPIVGILGGHNPAKSGDSSFLNSLVKSIERQGANALVVFFSAMDPAAKSLKWVVKNYFMKNGNTIVDAVITTHGHSLAAFMQGTESVNDLFKELGVPILKAIVTFNTFEKWRDSLLGLDFNEISWNVAMPEFDGCLITVPIAAKCVSEPDPLTGAKTFSNKPIPERLDKMVSLTINWAKLRHIPTEKRKVAIIFHNYPPRNDNIGCAAFLDSAPSAINLLQAMQKQGYQLDFIPENGKKLMETIISGLTNDQRWLSAEELASRTVAKTSANQYAEWLAEIPVDAKDKMVKHWGPPPGRLFNYKGALLVGGLLNGNVFIGIQPPRASEEDSANIYHNPEVPIPYHYHAYYQWIRSIFKANVVIHFGTHGTLEWLPGKSVGLSASCYPDIAITDLPNVYPYIIHNPGEGTGAKRRSYCCIVDYLTPVMHNADSYEDLAKLDVQLKEYYTAKGSDPSKIDILQKLIWDAVVQAKLNGDLSVTEQEVFSNFDGFIERLHAYLNELSDTHIQDGLHVLGEPPTGFALDEFLVALTRLNNGAIPSLRQSLAETKGYDYEDLLANRGKLRSDGRTNGDVINELNGIALELITKFHTADFKEDCVDDLLQNVVGRNYPNLRKCLTYVSSFLVPALNATTDELTNTLVSCGGGYVPAGPSGTPTRGTADILPTGRNFYSVDPQCIPSVAAWKVGVALGDALLKRYLQEEGKYPESIGNILWSIDTMRTNGECVAECLYIMGVRPVWAECSGRVLGVEPIPLEELKRPRIDVTVRISGLFRDNFPNLVHLLDEAVALVANLKETPDKNYLFKHVEDEVAERVASGVNLQIAREEALYRIFGDKPGNYGHGVGEAIESKNWKTRADLGNIYINWGGYIYGKKNFGMTAPDIFRRRLSQVQATAKNMNSREYDALQIDDTYGYHIGMDLGVLAVTGKRPRSYYGDSSDPNRVKVRSTAEEIKYCYRARLVNPKWIEGMQRHGYHGAAEFSRQMDYVFGWEATADVIEDWMWEEIAEKFVLDKKMQEWLKEVNPYALQNMTERLLEAIERELWQASDEMKKQLQQLYLQIEGLLEGEGENPKNQKPTRNGG
jgi:cobaltochelatase CobN